MHHKHTHRLWPLRFIEICSNAKRCIANTTEVGTSSADTEEKKGKKASKVHACYWPCKRTAIWLHAGIAFQQNLYFVKLLDINVMVSHNLCEISCQTMADGIRCQTVTLVLLSASQSCNKPIDLHQLNINCPLRARNWSRWLKAIINPHRTYAH